ncbi:DNA-directed RNA polymerase subunit RPC12/RpoP [Streptomyces sp. SLBN-8D4]|jgi:hypothetical protein
MRFGRANLKLRLLVLGWVLAGKPSNPLGSYGGSSSGGPGVKKYVYVCSRPDCDKDTRHVTSQIPSNLECPCGFEMLVNELVSDDFAELRGEGQTIWVCVKHEEPPVRAATGPRGATRQGHIFKLYAGD